LRLPDELREVEVVPADDRVLDQTTTAGGDFLFLFLALHELLIVAERDCLGELLRALNLVELFFNRLAELWVVHVLEDEDRLNDLAELFEGTVERVLFGVGVQPLEKLCRGGVLEFDSGDEA
jgi:hypothetical protein